MNVKQKPDTALNKCKSILPFFSIPVRKSKSFFYLEMSIPTYNGLTDFVFISLLVKTQ